MNRARQRLHERETNCTPPESIGIALRITTLVGQIVEFNLFVSNVISMIGLAVGIDYSLFIVSRFRVERKKGIP